MGKTIHGEARTIILKVLKFFEMEKANKQLAMPLEQAVERTCVATGISKRTLMNIKKEAKALGISPPSPGTSPRNEQKLPTPGKKRKQYKKKIDVNNFDLCAIRNIISNFYAVKEVPTLKNILEAAKRDLNFKGGRTSLRNILKNKLGYKFKKCKNPSTSTSMLHKPDIITWMEGSPPAPEKRQQ